ncbi:septum formation inhibitor Maf [Lysobacteraceae bacterium NML07-0707]|nr:septum formation inhibitor Maf [Xanthomonadaceae bacterium NML07-0707]
MSLYLASRSPRRSELLARLGVAFATLDLDIPEIRANTESPRDYVARVARQKAEAGLAQLDGAADAWVLAADTEVILGDEVLGKPADAADAAAMLARLAGRRHQVVTTLWLLSAEARMHAESVSEVTFAALSDAQIAAYVASGGWQGKAGGYAIQGVAEAFVSRLCGSYSGVMGLPLHETATLLRQAGVLA